MPDYGPQSNPPFSEYRTWLTSDEYRRRQLILEAANPASPREDWPVNITGQIQRHRELSMLAIKEAARHARIAIELANPDAPCAS